MRRGDLFVLSWESLRRVEWGKVSSSFTSTSKSVPASTRLEDPSRKGTTRTAKSAPYNPCPSREGPHSTTALSPSSSSNPQSPHSLTAAMKTNIGQFADRLTSFVDNRAVLPKETSRPPPCATDFRKMVNANFWLGMQRLPSE